MIWQAQMTDQLMSMVEDGEAMAEVASLPALDALDTSSVGAYYWDEDADLVYVKPIDVSGIDIYDQLYISTIQLRLSMHGEALDGLPYDGKVTSVPTLALRTAEIFDGKVGQVGSGSIAIENADAFLMREDIEIDGEAEIIAAFETFGGV